LGELIAELVRERIPGTVIHRLLDGAILFETSLGYDKLNFFCFNNIFAVIDLMEHDDPAGALEAHIQNAALDEPAAAVTIAPLGI